MLAWAFYDWANSAFPTVIQTFVFAAYFLRNVAPDPTTGTELWGDALSLVGITVALTGPVLGAIADHTGRRKAWISLFTVVCALASFSLWWIRPGVGSVWPALLLVSVGGVAVELACIFYNAMLPYLVSHARIGRWSGWGWGLGYAGGLVSLVLALALLRYGEPLLGLDGTRAEPVRAAFAMVGLWYLVFTVPLLLWTPDAPAGGKGAVRAARDGLRQLRESLAGVREYRHIVRFLVARMLYIDGLATLFAFGGIFAAGTFGMSEQEVLLFGIALNVTAGAGAATLASLDDRIGGKATILLALAGVALPATAMLLVRSKAMFWCFGLLLGVFVGPVQAASRSFMGRIAPEAQRGQMFGLYALSGKATAFAAPLTVAWATRLSGSQRVGMATILLFFAAGAALLAGVPADPRVVRGASEEGGA